MSVVPALFGILEALKLNHYSYRESYHASGIERILVMHTHPFAAQRCPLLAVPLYLDTKPAGRSFPFAVYLLSLMLLLAHFSGCGEDDTTADEAQTSGADNGLDGAGVITADSSGTSWSNRRIDSATTNPPTQTGGDLGTEGACGDAFESDVFRLLNEDRADNNLPPLSCNIHLIEVARLHSEDMAMRNFFAHTNPEGEQPWDRLNRYGVTNWTTVGENIARGDMTPAVVEQLWMDSPGHRANILNSDFTHIGVGVYRDGNNTTWTQLFARF